MDASEAGRGLIKTLLEGHSAGREPKEVGLSFRFTVAAPIVAQSISKPFLNSLLGRSFSLYQETLHRQGAFELQK